MKRLTKKDIDNTYYLNNEFFPEGTKLAIQKTGKIEDLEDEIGIDLITLFKAFTDGFWFKYAGNGLTTYDRYEFVSSDTDKDHLNLMRIWFDKETKKFSVLLDMKGGRVSLYDYGKTWALMKEELEK